MPYSDYPAWQGIPGAGQGIQCFPFASGWIVRGGAGGALMFVPDPDQIGSAGAGTTTILAAIANLQTNLQKEITTMSQTLSQQLDTATAAVETDVAAVAAEVSQLLASMTPGTQITQAQIDRVTAIDTAMKAIPPATPVVIQPPAPATP
jgi:hypothetical protein